MKRVHLITAWLAIVALLIDGLLPAAVAAAAQRDNVAPFALCGAATGSSHPDRAPSPVPVHHCTLCAVCAGLAVGLLSNRADGLTARISAGQALPAIVRSASFLPRRPAYAAAQPRAPPEPAS